MLGAGSLPVWRTLRYAAGVADPSENCSFCSKLADHSLQLFRPEANFGNASVAICEECVLTCAKAIDVEQRLSERPASKPRGDSAPDSDRPLPEADWQEFQVGTLQLQWRAEPAVIVSVRRKDNHERVVVEHFGREVDPTIDDAETIAEDHWVTLHG